LTTLSVNINKIATLRNARGGSIPDVARAAADCERFGAGGITVHPRPDRRHIRYDDVYAIKKIITTEFNIEGYPSEDFLRLVEDVKPLQVTLVPDAADVLTSNAGWDALKNRSMLRDVVARLKAGGMRVSLFMDPDPDMIAHAKETGTDRVELYTESYASMYEHNRDEAIAPFIKAAEAAALLNLGINAGHDLNLQNLAFFKIKIPRLLEVSIGHALISDALYWGLENSIQLYKRQLM